MRPLTASKIIPGKKQELIDVNNLFDLPSRTDKEYMEYLATVGDDLGKRGMVWPILVIKKDDYWNRFPWQDDSKIGIITGSNRFRYARDRGYTHIESIVCGHRGDWFPLWEKTFLRVNEG